MMEIIREGHYEKYALCFRCNRCGTEFKTDEYFIMHAPIQAGQTEPGERYFYVHCPVCKHSISSPVKF